MVTETYLQSSSPGPSGLESKYHDWAPLIKDLAYQGLVCWPCVLGDLNLLKKIVADYIDVILLC